MIKNILILSVGLVMGAGISVGCYFYVHRTTTVWTTTAALTGINGLVIPAGTEMVYERAMPEGFYTVKLYINLTVPTAEHKTKESISGHPFLIPPVWAE